MTEQELNSIVQVMAKTFIQDLTKTNKYPDDIIKKTLESMMQMLQDALQLKHLPEGNKKRVEAMLQICAKMLQELNSKNPKPIIKAETRRPKNHIVPNTKASNKLFSEY